MLARSLPDEPLYGSSVPILYARYVGVAPLLAAPTAKAFEAKDPEAAGGVRNEDQPILVAHIDTESAVEDRVEVIVEWAEVGVVLTYGYGS